jgi:hypothetical protein
MDTCKTIPHPAASWDYLKRNHNSSLIHLLPTFLFLIISSSRQKLLPPNWDYTALLPITSYALNAARSFGRTLTQIK